MKYSGLFTQLFAIATAGFTVTVYPNILSSNDSTRISGMIVLITWHTWFPDSFSPFIFSKRGDSLQSVCFELSKRNQRHVSTWNKRYSKMSPAAHDMMNYNHMLISWSCSNGLFTLRSIANPLGLLHTVDMDWWTERSTAVLGILMNTQLWCSVPSIGFDFSASQEQLKIHLCIQMCPRWKIVQAVIITLFKSACLLWFFLLNLCKADASEPRSAGQI